MEMFPPSGPGELIRVNQPSGTELVNQPSGKGRVVRINKYRCSLTLKLKAEDDWV